MDKKNRFDLWPKLVLGVLVMGFCLFVGIRSLGLFTGSLSLLNPTDPSTYVAVRNNMDEAYAYQMFADNTPDEEKNDPTASKPQKSVETQLRDAFVDINGMATDALGQRELNGVIKLDNGYITAYLPEKLDLSYQVQKTVEFYQYSQGLGKQFVFVMAPHLIDKYQPMLPAGFVDYFNEMADEFLLALDAAGVPSIDLRAQMQEAGYDHYGGFFRTDHHWTPALAAWANDRVVRTLHEWGWLNTSGITLTPEDFEQRYEGVAFYGTAAQRTGEAFAGASDTLTCLLPKQDIQLQTRRYNEEQYGSINFEATYRDWQYAEYDRTYGPDAYYLYKSAYDITVLNEGAAVQNSVTMVCDSFGVPYQSFMSAYVRQLTCFDGRTHPDLAPAVEQSDIVMVLFNPSSLDIRTENASIFNFR